MVMALGVCLITSGNPGADNLAKMLENCGLQVWTPQSPDARDGHIYDEAVCLIIDLPQNSALGLVRLFRLYGIKTPALLVVDPNCETRPEMLDCGWIMDVIPRPANPLRILRWVQSMCATKRVFNRVNRREDRLSA